MSAPPPPSVLVLGAGLMGSQIASEYALGGHAVTVGGRDPERAAERVGAALELAVSLGLADRRERDAAAGRLRCEPLAAALATPVELVVESVAEQLELKGSLLARVAAASPGAIIATNTSSIPIGEVGAAAGAPERTIGTHYWNPPLLMPQVEVVLGPATDRATRERTLEILTALGKRPVLVERDVPGFLWNRLQAALLREALWLVENGVATPQAVDAVVREGLARRATLTGPFETIALGGAATWAAMAERVFPELSDADRPGELERWLPDDPERLARLRERRDAGLAAALRAERSR